MEMAHALPSIRPRVDYNAVTALTQAFPLGQFGREPKHPSHKLVVTRIQMAQAGDMFPRYYENVHWRLGVDIAKRQQLIVLVNHGRGDLLRGYLTEDAIAHCLHPLY